MIDAHAHLPDPRFARDLAEVIARAEAAGVTRILAVGEDVASSEAAIAVARAFPTVRAAVGIHPHHAPQLDDGAVRRLRTLAADDHVVAVGEIGLDLSGRSAPRPDQERALQAQLELAVELGMPVSMHVRGSGHVVRAIVDRVTGSHGYVHCYS